VRIRALTVLVAGLLASLVATARADTIKIGRFSDQATPRRALIGAEVKVARSKEGSQTNVSPRLWHPRKQPTVIQEVGGAGPALPSAFPSLSVNDPLARNPSPAGPQTFWYQDGFGHACIFHLDGTPVCYTLVSPGGGAAPGPITNPAVVGAAVAKRLGLSPGEIKASPADSGMTGAESWFWLEPAPQPAELSVTLGGETVTVSAEPEVEWRFGDGSELTGGAGVPYEAGASPAGAIRHLYETRCLPGDRDRNPYVLPSCGAAGYSVEALVVWHVSFSASGPVAQSGTLPTRTTESSAVYPVSESRAFLAGGTSR
jgi:hypothetical protein